MAILLIKDSDAVHADPVKDLRGCYKRGDVVQVFEDGTQCVIPPAPPFYIVELTGLSKLQAEKYVQSDVDRTDPENPITLRRRRFGLVIADIPLAVRQDLQTNRYIKRPWSQVRAFVKDKITGLGE